MHLMSFLFGFIFALILCVTSKIVISWLLSPQRQTAMKFRQSDHHLNRSSKNV